MTGATLNGCTISQEMLEKFPHQVYGRFISSTLTANNITEGILPQTVLEMVEEIEKCGQSSISMGSLTLTNDPYPIRLVELGGLEEIRNTKNTVLLESMEIYTYDPKLIGSTFQDTDVNTETTSSISSSNQVLLQSQYLNGMIGQSQPNFVLPQLYIDGRAFLTGNRSGRAGVQSIGLPTPLCRGFYTEIQSPDIIDFSCGAGVWIPGEAKIRRLFVVGVLNFRLKQ